MKNSIRKTMLGLTLAAACGSAQVAHAKVVDGFFKADNKSNSKVIVKTVQQNGVETSYAAILWSDAQTSLFRIEEVDGTTQAWVQLFQSKDFILATDISQEATFAVQVGVDSDNKPTLSMAPTDFGKSIGCDRTMKFIKTDGDSWRSMSDLTGAFEISDKPAASLASASSAGEYTLQGDQALENKTFALNELFPGLAVLRAQALDPDSIDGRALERKISFVALALDRVEPGFFFSSSKYQELRLVRFNAGERGCSSSTLRLTRD